MPSPRVTVFIPAFNREDYVGAAIASALCQTHQDLECLVIDDGSTDGTLEVVRGFDDARVRLVENGENRGIPRTRNRGIDEARGELLALLDSDDLARPERVERQVAFLDAHPELCGVGSWARVIDAAGATLRSQTCPVTSPGLAFTTLFRCAPRQSTMLLRRDVLTRERYREDFPVSSDLELFGRLARHAGLGALPEQLTELRQHPQRITVQQHTERGPVRREIFRVRLRELGLEPTAADLDRHLLLAAAKVEHLAGKLDAEILAWAEGWLTDLVRREITFHEERGRDASEVAQAAATVWSRFLKKAAHVLGSEAVLAHSNSALLGTQRRRFGRWKLAWRAMKGRLGGAQTGKRR